MNALSPIMMSEIQQNMAILDKNPKTKVIVFLSKIKSAFCAGAFIRSFKELNYETMLL
jgi:enoyl-CoA hydratase/carnithine racemase